MDIISIEGLDARAGNKEGVRSPVSGGKPGPLRLMGLFVFGSALPVRPSPGPDRPAIDAAKRKPLHSALATMAPCLHIGFRDIACVGGWPANGDLRDGRYRCDAAGEFPVRVSYHID
jgi:hypothetical protein